MAKWHTADEIHSDLLAAKKRVYDPCAFICSEPTAEPEGADYAAHEFTVNGLAIRFRVAKTTPTKVGQFVTVWKRSSAGPIRPFDTTDQVDLFVISSRIGKYFGQFVFSTKALYQHGVVSVNKSGGKRGFRIYPPWVGAPHRQASNAQKWQLNYFLPLDSGMPVDLDRARKLYRQ